jgi:HEAT repeat protein
VVWERFYQHLETTAGMSWSRRRRHERTLVADLQALGEPAVEALMQLLQESPDSRERSTAAFLLGSLQDSRAVPILQEVLANEDDIVMRRAAARGMARVQTSDTIPILDTILTNGQEDRYMRLSAAYGLARMGESQGIDGLASIFEESNADGRGHYITFRALMALDDPRVLPVMRQIAESEVSYKLGAIRFLGAHGDQEALPFLQQMVDAPHEQQSVREAAEQALAAIGGGR